MEITGFRLTREAVDEEKRRDRILGYPPGWLAYPVPVVAILRDIVVEGGIATCSKPELCGMAFPNRFAGMIDDSFAVYLAHDFALRSESIDVGGNVVRSHELRCGAAADTGYALEHSSDRINLFTEAPHCALCGMYTNRKK